MQEAVGSLALQWQDRPEGADAAYREFLAAQRRCRGLGMSVEAGREAGPVAGERLAKSCLDQLTR